MTNDKYDEWSFARTSILHSRQRPAAYERCPPSGEHVPLILPPLYNRCPVSASLAANSAWNCAPYCTLAQCSISNGSHQFAQIVQTQQITAEKEKLMHVTSLFDRHPVILCCTYNSQRLTFRCPTIQTYMRYMTQFFSGIGVLAPIRTLSRCSKHIICSLASRPPSNAATHQTAPSCSSDHTLLLNRLHSPVHHTTPSCFSDHTLLFLRPHPPAHQTILSC